MTMHRINSKVSLIILSLSFVFLLPINSYALTEAQERAIATAIDAMLGGNKVEQFKIIDHKFNFEKNLAIVDIDGSKVQAFGRFTHFLRLRRDDVVTFTITFEDGSFVGFEKNVQDRGTTELLNLARGATSFWTPEELKKLGIDLNKGFKEFNEFLQEASDKSWQQEAEIIIANVARVMYLNGLPIAANVVEVPFDCRVTGNNAGCSKRVACSGGATVSFAVAACNLEYGAVSDSDLEGVSRGTIRVVRASDKRDDGECGVADNRVKSGAVNIRNIRGLNAVEVFCKEHDKNGGDCHIRGTLYCEGSRVQARGRDVIIRHDRLKELVPFVPTNRSRVVQ